MNAVAPHVTAPRSPAVLACLAAVYLVWGSTYWAMRVAVESIPPFFMLGCRYVACGALLLLFARVRGARWPTFAVWRWAAPIGFLLFVVGNSTVAYAERTISSGAAAVICGAMPLFAAGFGRWFGARATAREWVGITVGVSGIVVLALGQELRAEPKAAALVMLAPVAWSLGSLLARKSPSVDGLVAAAMPMVTGGLLMLVLSPLAGEVAPTLSAVPLRALLSWAYLAVFGSIVAFSAYTYLLKHTRPSVATSYAYVTPVLAVGVGIVLGHERPGWNTWAAVVLIVAATVVVMRAPTDTSLRVNLSPTPGRDA